MKYIFCFCFVFFAAIQAFGDVVQLTNLTQNNDYIPNPQPVQNNEYMPNTPPVNTYNQAPQPQFNDPYGASPQNNAYGVPQVTPNTGAAPYYPQYNPQKVFQEEEEKKKANTLCFISLGLLRIGVRTSSCHACTESAPHFGITG